MEPIYNIIVIISRRNFSRHAVKSGDRRLPLSVKPDRQLGRNLGAILLVGGAELRKEEVLLDGDLAQEGQRDQHRPEPYWIDMVAGAGGFEPPVAEPKSAALPLGYAPIGLTCIGRRQREVKPRSFALQGP